MGIILSLWKFNENRIKKNKEVNIEDGILMEKLIKPKEDIPVSSLKNTDEEHINNIE